MEKNIGNLDKIIRVLVGLVLIALVFVGPHTAWGWIGVPVIAIRCGVRKRLHANVISALGFRIF